MSTEATERQMAKVRGLLSKAEGTDNELEAATYLEKAQDLMRQWNIDEAKLRATLGEDAPEPTVAWVAGSPAQWWRHLAAAAADASNVNYAVRTGRKAQPATRYRKARGAVNPGVVFAGLPADVEWCIALHTSLVLQCESAARRAARNDLDYQVTAAAGQGRAWLWSFRVGYALRVRDRVAEVLARQAQDKTPGAALVPVKPGLALLGKTGPMNPGGDFDGNAFESGQRAGNSAGFGRHHVGSGAQKAISA